MTRPHPGRESRSAGVSLHWESQDLALGVSRSPRQQNVLPEAPPPRCTLRLARRSLARCEMRASPQRLLGKPAMRAGLIKDKVSSANLDRATL